MYPNFIIFLDCGEIKIMEIGCDKNISWKNTSKNSDNSNLDWQQIMSFTILAEASLQVCMITIWLQLKIK